MSRVIKFRAWTGSQMLNRTLFDRNWYNDADQAVQGIRPEDRSDLKVMQFTGLRDKKGVEIYEGDIVRVGTEYSSLTMQNGNPVYETVRMIHGAWEPLHIFKDRTFVLHGNIHENPELVA